MSEFLDGVAFAGFIGIAVWFARSWRDTRDRLLLAFSVAFAIFAVNRVVLAATDPAEETANGIYVLRAVAFVVIIGAIIDRNREPE